MLVLFVMWLIKRYRKVQVPPAIPQLPPAIQFESNKYNRPI